MNKNYILAIFLYIIFSTKKEKYFNKLEIINNGNKVINTTKIKYIDTILYIGLQKLNIEQKTISITPLKNNIILDKNIELQGLIQQINKNYYKIYIKEGKKRRFYLNTISHELIHLQQYVNNDFKIEGDYIYYKGVKYNKRYLPLYMDRPWEVDVIKKSTALKKEITNILF